MCVQATALFSRVFTTSSLETFTVPAALLSLSLSVESEAATTHPLSLAHFPSCFKKMNDDRIIVVAEAQRLAAAEPR